MKPKCKSCSSCGMPMEKPDDFALGNTTSEFCKYCTDEKGELLSFDKLLKMNTKCYVDSQGITEEAAAKMALELLRNQPAWKGFKHA